MKKHVFIILIVSISIFILAGCSSKTKKTKVREMKTDTTNQFKLESSDKDKKPLEDIFVFDEDGVTIKREGHNLVLSMPELILFDFNKYDIKSQIKGSLSKLAKALVSNPDIRIKIDGYTDFIGTESYNLELSVKRARAIKEFLVDNDVIENNISIEGYGKQNPISSNETEEGRSQNRRVQFILSRY